MKTNNNIINTKNEGMAVSILNWKKKFIISYIHF